MVADEMIKEAIRGQLASALVAPVVETAEVPVLIETAIDPIETAVNIAVDYVQAETAIVVATVE